MIREWNEIKSVELNQEQLKKVLQFAYEKGNKENTSLQELMSDVAELLQPLVIESSKL